MSARVLSLFSGGGGLDLGLETAGAQVAAMCEIDPHAASVLRHRWGVTATGAVVELADSHRYRICGNGVVSPVAAWIGRRIVEAAA